MDLINIEHIQFLEVLIDWRILDYNSLIEANINKRYSSYETAKKLIQRLKKKKIVETYRDPWNKKAYIYLSVLGEKIVSPDLNINLCKETLYHDLKVSGLCFELLKISEVVKSIELEHKFKVPNKKSLGSEIVPDAKLFGSFKGKEFIAAIELELTQKEKSRILSKTDLYLKSTYFDFAFYFFPNQNLLNRYRLIFEKNYGVEFNSRIFLFTAEFLFSGKSLPLSESGRAMNKDQSLLELFEIKSFAPE